MPMHMPIDVLGFITLQQFCLNHLQIVISYLAVSSRLLMRSSLRISFAEHEIKLESR